MSSQKNSVLSSDDIKAFNQQGKYGLDETGGKTYILKFAFNDQRNKAADPVDFQIATQSLDKIAQSAVGRPYVFNPGIKNNVGEHVRGEVDDPAKIIQFQKKFAIGDIVAWFRNPKSNNVYFIIEVYPEYVDDVMSGKIPLPTSPLIEPLEMDSNRVVTDAHVLHLQAVPFSGYPMQLTQKLGVCKGMLDKCSSELRTLGSSGQLKKFRKQFSYSETTLGSSMSAEQGQTAPQMKVEDIVAKHDQMLADHGKMLEEHGKTLGSIGDQVGQILKNTSNKPGDNYPGTDKSVGQTTGSKGAVPGPAGTQSGMGTYGSAGSETEMVQVPKSVLQGMEADLKTIKDQIANDEKAMQEKAEKLAQKERELYAKVISEGEVLLKEFPVDKLQERIKFYVDLVDANKTPVDLTLLATKYESIKRKTLGSSGFSFNNDEELFPSIETLGASGNNTKPKPRSLTDVISEASN